MAKKKKPKQQQQPLSPSQYIRLKGRSLPIAACYVNDDWLQKGIACVIVARQHLSGNYTMGYYLVDTFCLGVKDVGTYFHITQEELTKSADKIPNCTKITYNEAHNIIYGALAYAQEEAGIAPHPNFQLGQYLLNEDTDEIPLIEYEYGKDGKPFLIVKTKFEASKYLPELKKRHGEDIPFIIKEDMLDEDDEEEEDEEYDEEEEDEEYDEEDENEYNNIDAGINILQTVNEKDLEEVAKLTHTTYAYTPPSYPATLIVTHSELAPICNQEYFYSLPHPVIQQLLALPRETLIADLSGIILCELGKSGGEITQEMIDQYANTVTHAVFLLGELKATESLQSVLEVLRQSDECLNFHFGDSRIETLCPTLYYIARNQTDELLAFMKEPSLSSSSRSYVSHTMAFIGFNEPERRKEVIEWFRLLLRFLITNVSDSTLFDASLAGMITSNLLDIHAVELLPEVKELYDTGQVDFTICGHYAAVEQEMPEGRIPVECYLLEDIYKRYQRYKDIWDY